MSNNQPKKNRQVKFEDVLCMYKYIKDIYAKLEDLDRRLKTIEEWIIKNGVTKQ